MSYEGNSGPGCERDSLNTRHRLGASRKQPCGPAALESRHEIRDVKVIQAARDAQCTEQGETPEGVISDPWRQSMNKIPATSSLHGSPRRFQPNWVSRGPALAPLLAITAPTRKGSAESDFLQILVTHRLRVLSLKHSRKLWTLFP